MRFLRKEDHASCFDTNEKQHLLKSNTLEIIPHGTRAISPLETQNTLATSQESKTIRESKDSKLSATHCEGPKEILELTLPQEAFVLHCDQNRSLMNTYIA